MLKFVKSDPMSRQLTLQWVKPDGSPIINASVAVLAIDKPFPKGGDGSVRYQNTLNPSHPEYLIDPKAIDIGGGKVFEVDSYKLGITKVDEPYYSWRDGVINVNIYVGGDNITVTGLKDTNYLVGTGLQPILENYDSVIVGKDVYQLDKSKSTNAGTILFLTSDLKEDVSSVTVAVKDNLKLYNDFRTRCAIAQVAQVLTDTNYYRPSVNEKSQAVLKLITNKQASKILFDQESYLEADRLLQENIDIIKFLQLC